MRLWIKRIFNLSDIRYSWLLIFSMIIFIFSLYNNKINPNINVGLEILTYGIAIGSSFVWSILNYVDHIKVNAIYKNSNDIDSYVNSLIMSRDEKDDLKQYLNDFVKDLEESGKTKDEAIKTAISQFQVNEFTSLSKNTGILELPSHYYLIGYVIIFAVIIILTQFMISLGLEGRFWLYSINFMLTLYSLGFLGLFLLYKMVDSLIARKTTN
ncbi:hypothetical protein R0131_10795 [Clostridium sp. AL.422]|uniref:hypothetical protein n=1 Tax=Clostridium TaxID=1485 RepID=UPI00293DA2E9|nr:MULTISPECIES: hypothetical protein [unclassified Clostridium]MDV4151329.1 hypothetical protein [Clostridium sp. AL.422]